jgi:hypothetical protein
MDFETIWYEAFPFLYGIGGLVAIFSKPGPGLLKVSGVLLIIASLTVLRLRWVYRRSLYVQTQTVAEVLKTRYPDPLLKE